jgi:uracil-DNA glycosylase family 4
MEIQSEANSIGKKQNAIERLNHRIRNCEQCRLSITRRHVLVGEGDPNARITVVALSPGEKEDDENRMFIGPSGKILDKLFDAAGIHKESIYMTNLIKCTLPKNRRPKMDEIESCNQFLDKEIAIIHPEIIVPLGYYATRTIFMKYHADPPAARTDYAKNYGKLVLADNQKIYPLPHPASLLYNPSFESETMVKYKKLQTLSNDCKWFPMCPMKRFYESKRLEKKWIALYCKGDWQSCIRFEMEEDGRSHPDWMLPDGSLDERLKEF